jgi:Rod binding domain-containing protein
LHGPRVGDTGGRTKNDPLKLKQAAQEFESLLLAQILRSVREAGSGGWLGSGENQEMSSTMELAEAQLSRAMAQSGALGITKLLAGELRLDSPPEAGTQRPATAAETAAARFDRGDR